MKRRYTALSVIVMGAVAWALIVPAEITKTESEKNAPTKLTQEPKLAPYQVVAMTTINLPPPPPPSPTQTEYTTPASSSITPMAAPASKPTTTKAPVRAQPPTAPTVRKAVQIRSLTPLLAPARAVDAPVRKTREILHKTAGTSPSSPGIRQPVKPPSSAENKINKTRKTTAEARKKGRPLLKLLEFGNGPSIEISWPDDASTRAHLYNVFNRCYGMQVAFMSDDGTLFDDTGNSGQSRAFNGDKFSGFVRQSQGRAARSEEIKIRSIRDRHGLRSGIAVRLFPRDTDALLLAGLHQLIGHAYSENKTIQARYKVSGWRVQVGDIRSNGVPVAGSVDLSGAVKTKCLI